MSDEDILKIWRYLITAFVACFLAGVGSCQMTQHNIVRAIDAGADPIGARCALVSTETEKCAVYAYKEKAQ